MNWVLLLVVSFVRTDVVQDQDDAIDALADETRTYFHALSVAFQKTSVLSRSSDDPVYALPVDGFGFLLGSDVAVYAEDMAKSARLARLRKMHASEYFLRESSAASALLAQWDFELERTGVLLAALQRGGAVGEWYDAFRAKWLVASMEAVDLDDRLADAKQVWEENS